jgi:hypothetical protein
MGVDLSLKAQVEPKVDGCMKANGSGVLAGRPGTIQPSPQTGNRRRPRVS